MRPRGTFLSQVWAIPLVVVLLAALALPAAASHDRLQEIERRKQEIQRKQSELAVREGNLSAAVRQLDARRAEAESEVRSLDARLQSLDRRIVQVQKRLTRTQVELALLHDDLLKIQKRLVGRTNVLTERAVASYKAGPTAYLDSLLTSETFSDLYDRFAYYQSALNADSQLVEQIQVLRDATAVQRDLVEEKREEIAAAHKKLADSRNEVAQLRSQKAELLAQRLGAMIVQDAQEIAAIALRFELDGRHDAPRIQPVRPVKRKIVEQNAIQGQLHQCASASG